MFIIYYGDDHVTVELPSLWQVLLRFGYDSHNHSCRTWTGAIRLDLEICACTADGLHENTAGICCKFLLQVQETGQVWVTKYSILLKFLIIF